MRSNFVLVLIAVAMFVAFGGTANATTFFSDTFSYPDGPLIDSGKWRNHSGSGDPVLVTAGQAVSNNSGSNDVNRNANGNVTGGGNETWYFAALITVADSRADPNTALESQSYVIHFRDSGNFNFVTRAHVTDPAGASGFRFGLRAGSGTADVFTQDLNFDQQYKVVGSFNATTGDAELWIDPTDIGDTSITHTDPGRIGTLIEALGIRQDGSGPDRFSASFDSMALGNDFDSVLLNSMNGSNIPEPASLALALLGLAGIASTRRRR